MDSQFGLGGDVAFMLFIWPLLVPFHCCSKAKQRSNHKPPYCLSSFKAHALVVVYFDDVLIYNKTEVWHKDRLTEIMVVLDKKKLYGNLKKCTFISREMTFIGYIVTAQKWMKAKLRQFGHGKFLRAF